MVNLVETLLGLAAVAAIAAIILFLARRRSLSRRLAIAAVVFGLLGGLLELYLRI